MKKFLLGFVILSIMANAAIVGAEEARIQNGKKVKLDYTLTVDGKVMDSTQGQVPLEYVQGQGQIIKGLEKQLQGMKVGDEKTIKVSSEEAYGPVDPKAFQEIPHSAFPPNIDLKVGMMIPLQDKQGHPFPTVVKEIKKDTVVLNFNHPLAGKDLVFKVKIVGIQ